MFEMIPFNRNNLTRKEDFFSPFWNNFFDDDFFPTMHNLQGNIRVDLKETDENYVVEADLPGIKKDDINIEFNNNYLVISAKRDDSAEDKNENYVTRERHYGEFKRSFYTDNVDESKIDASFNDGVLKIILPKLNKGKDEKKKIDIH